jgi:hypothetical protein
MSIHAVSHDGIPYPSGAKPEGSLRCLDERRYPAPTTAAQPSRID